MNSDVVIFDIQAYEITDVSEQIHSANKKWWTDMDPKNPKDVTVKLALVVTEVSEAIEGVRKGLMDDKLPQYEMVDVEIADAIIRLLDLAGARGIDIGWIIRDKLNYNAVRVDHTQEHRDAEGGKKF